MQLGLEALFAEPGWSVTWFGLVSPNSRFMGVTFGDLISGGPSHARVSVGPVEYRNQSVDADDLKPCINNGFATVETPFGRCGDPHRQERRERTIRCADDP